MNDAQTINFALPEDVSAELPALQRKQLIMQMLLQRGLQPTPMPENYGRRASPVSPLAPLAQMLQTYIGAKGAKSADEESAGLAAKYNKSITDTLMAAQQARTGMPATEGASATGPTDQTSPSAATLAAPAVPGNADVANMMLVRNPITRQLGMDQIKKQMDIQAFISAAKQAGGGGGAGGTGGMPVGFGGPAGGTPMAVWLQGDPSGKSYLEALAKDNAPITQREGDIVRRMPDGTMQSVFSTPKGGIAITRDTKGQAIGASEVPGYGKAQASIQGQEAAAKAEATNPYELVNVVDAEGRSVPKFKYQVAGYPGGKPSPSGQPPESGAPASADPVWKTVPKRFIPQGIGQSTYNATVAKEQGQQAVKLSDELGQAAQVANQRKALNDQSLQLVDKAATGPLATKITDIKSYLLKFVPGMKESDFAGSVSANQELQKDLVNAATQKAKQQFGSRITQSEVMLMLNRGAPNVDMTKAAIKYLIQTDNAQARYDMDMANHFGQYVQSGGDPSRFKGWHATTFPMTDYLSKAGLAPGGKIVAPAAPTAKAVQVSPPALKPPIGLEGWHIEEDADGHRAWVNPARKEFREIR